MDKDGQVGLEASNSRQTLRLIRRERITYKDPTGKVRDWESCERTTRPKGSDIDGVGIVAILEKTTGMR